MCDEAMMGSDRRRQTPFRRTSKRKKYLKISSRGLVPNSHVLHTLLSHLDVPSNFNFSRVQGYGPVTCEIKSVPEVLHFRQMFHGLRGVVVAGADRGRGVVNEKFGGEDKAGLPQQAGVNSAFWSYALADHVLDQRLKFPQVWG